MSLSTPYQFIALEGNIGAGKTTLCKMLAKEMNAKLILEQFSDNPFLPHFYENPERFGFPVELFFMTERHKQLQENLLQAELFYDLNIADYYFMKTLLFAKNNLSEEEFRLFSRLFHVLNSTFPNPDLLLYLHRPVEVLLKNIKNRGRTYEQHITSDYLLGVQEAYFNYFKTVDSIPILILNLGDNHFDEGGREFQFVLDVLQKDYKPQTYYLNIL